MQELEQTFLEEFDGAEEQLQRERFKNAVILFSKALFALCDLLLHSKLGIDQCEARKLIAQSAHFHLCLMAYAILKKEQYLTSKSIYRIKRKCSFNFKTADNILSKLNFQSA